MQVMVMSSHVELTISKGLILITLPYMLSMVSDITIVIDLFGLACVHVSVFVLCCG